MEAFFAIPGALSTRTGGYAYDRRILREAEDAGFPLRLLPLPGGFPAPSDEELEETGRRLGAAPAGAPLLIDGLALGAMPEGVLARASGPVVALCHHPLALETGLDAALAERLAASERGALARSVAVITTSRTTAGILTAEYQVPAGKIVIAPPGTDPGRPSRGSGGLEVALLSVGGLIPRKGHDVLLRALAEIREADWRLTIVGPEDHDPVHAAALRKLARDLGIAARVEFAGGADEAEVIEHYDRADVFVLASRYEGFGMVYAEAIARGLPVIGTRAGAVPEATLGAAELIEPGDVAGLAAALDRMVRDPAARRVLAARALAAAGSLPRWSDTASRILAVLRRAGQDASP